ncbi:MAG: respiratory nitrate reductase subunit beta, partial [Pseudomonadota bacterium]
GYRDDEAGPIHQLVEKYKVALPLHPEWGTKPNVFYVPPMSPPKFGDNGEPTGESRVPLEYLESLFGDGVASALETLAVERQKKADGDTSELMDTLIGYRHAEMFKLS